MPTYRRPGVYIARPSPDPLPVAAAATAIPAFIGCSSQGPTGEPHAVGSWAACEMLYGAPEPSANSSPDSQYRGALCWALRAWFLNGGGEARVIRLEPRPNGEPDSDSYTAAMDALAADNCQLLLLPGLVWDGGAGQAILDSAVAHCEQRRDRMLLIDPPPGQPLASAADIGALALTASSYAACYYPWPTMYHADAPGRQVAVSPAAFAAANWARSDRERGVWKAPAGIGAQLHGVTALQYPVSSADLGALTRRGINALRQLPGHGNVIWGARTLASQARPEWRYLPVRRTALFLEKSIDKGTEWAVFEENTPTLWATVKANVERFMNGLYREGAFQGARASEAYFVRCGLGQTMTQTDIKYDRLVLQVGFAPLKPAEFVVLRWEFHVGNAQVRS